MRNVSRHAAVMLALGSAALAAAHEGSHERMMRLDALVEATPDDAWLRLERGALRREHGDYAAALDDLERARRLAPTLADADAELARLHAGVHRYSLAAAAADRFVAARPDDAAGYALRAGIRAAVGDRAPAIADFDRAVLLASAPPPDWYIERARLVAGSGRDADLRAAVAGLDRGIERIGAAAPLVLEAVDLEARFDVDRAIDRLDRWSANAPRRESWLARRGDVLFAAGRSEEAHAAYVAARDAIAALKPKHRETAATRDLAAHVQDRLARLEATHPEANDGH